MSPNETITYRPPTVEDASGIWRLVRDSGVLDCNSAYVYLLLCRDFAKTCLVATVESIIVGFVTGYRRPENSRTLFVWQIGVAADWRGRRIGSALLDRVVQRARAETPVDFVEATVAADNPASRKLFQSFASAMNVPLHESAADGFPAELFPDGQHEAEPIIRLGPFPRSTAV